MNRADAHHPVPDLQDMLERIYVLRRDGIVVDLSFRQPLFDLLHRLGDPHLRLPPCIHIAGTNGKGSTISLLRAILEAHGKRVHVYTSPHLVRFNERIVLAGREIDDVDLLRRLNRIWDLNAGGEITFFEFTTALVLDAFVEVPADIVLLETGLGGRLDTTNVIPTPLLSLITRVSMDHMEFLGETLREIAGEKAGIIKPGCPVLLAPQQDSVVADVVMAKAKEIGASLCDILDASRFSVSMPGEASGFELDGKRWPVPALEGAHQLENAASAVAALSIIEVQLGWTFDPARIREGLASVDWPARLQRLPAERFPLEDPSAFEIYLDGGHNDSAGSALARQVQLWKKAGHPKVHLILGMLARKPVEAFLSPLFDLCETVSIVPVPSKEVSLTHKDLSKISFCAGSQKVRGFSSVAAALSFLAGSEDGSAKVNDPQIVLIAGSLYLAGAVLDEIGLAGTDRVD